jgi:hypothetical protein
MTTPDGRYDYSWDGTGTDLTAIGRLASESLTSSTLGNTRTEYRYQGPTGAVSQVRRQIRGQTFTTDIAYNTALDLPETVSLTTPSGPTFTARYAYDTGGFGQITQIRDDIVNRTLWTLGDIDAFGEVSTATYGNLVAVTRTRERTTGLLERCRTRRSSTTCAACSTSAKTSRGRAARCCRNSRTTRSGGCRRT